LFVCARSGSDSSGNSVRTTMSGPPCLRRRPHTPRCRRHCRV